MWPKINQTTIYSIIVTPEQLLDLFQLLRYCEVHFSDRIVTEIFDAKNEVIYENNFLSRRGA